jgi:hypothetical protein
LGIHRDTSSRSDRVDEACRLYTPALHLIGTQTIVVCQSCSQCHLWYARPMRCLILAVPLLALLAAPSPSPTPTPSPGAQATFTAYQTAVATGIASPTAGTPTVAYTTIHTSPALPAVTATATPRPARSRSHSPHSRHSSPAGRCERRWASPARHCCSAG